MRRHIMISAILFLMAMVCTESVMAQRNKKDDDQKPATSQDSFTQKQIELQKGVYSLAMQYRDGDMAKSALFSLMALGADDANYRDSLLFLYINTGNIANGILLGRELVKEDPNNERVLSALAIAEQNGGLYREALGRYEDLYKVNQKLFYLYQIADIQFKLQRIGECRNTIAAILGNPNAMQETVNINYSQKEGQQVPIKAAALNILGVIEMSLKNKEGAEKYFAEAIQAFPDFKLAQGNLEVLKNPPKE